MRIFYNRQGVKPVFFLLADKYKTKGWLKEIGYLLHLQMEAHLQATIAQAAQRYLKQGG